MTSISRDSIIITSLLLFPLLLCSTTTTPWFTVESFDSNLFQQIGLGILQGKTPHIDLFDNKGPLLYLINAFGLFLNRTCGIFVLQVFSLYISVFFLLKCTVLININKRRLPFTLLLIFLLFSYFENGNMTEEWSLPFLCISFYHVILSLEKQGGKITFSQAGIIGICLGCILFIRPNNVAPTLGLLCYLFWFNIKEGKFKSFIKSCSIIFLGIIIVSFPFFIWYYKAEGYNGIYKLFYCSILFNLKYIQEYIIAPSVLFQLKSFAPILLCIGISGCCYKCNKPLTAAIISSFLCTLPGLGANLFRHYFIVFIPAIFITCVLLLKTKQAKWLYTIMLLCFVIASINPTIRCINNIRSGEHNHILERKLQFATLIEHENKDDLQDIWNYNACMALDLLNSNNIVQSNRLIVKFSIPELEPLIEEESIKLRASSPKYIMKYAGERIGNEEDRAFIDNNYHSLGSTSALNVHNVELLKRNK